MQQYINLLKNILANGTIKHNRTGIDTISIFGTQDRYDLQRGFPAVTTKKLAFKSVLSELLWFIEGSNDERRLAEIRYGKKGGVKTIWTANANSESWLKKAKFPGDVGRIYGVNWRKWRAPNGKEIDQLTNLINGIQNDPDGRRHVLMAYNPGELDEMCLPPCHMFAQFYVANKKLSCHMYQRSSDVPIGVPFNIASYALLTHMIAHVCDLGVGEFIHTNGDAHIYMNQIPGVYEQISRQPLQLPTLWIDKNIKNINDFTMNSIELHNYVHHPQIIFPFSV